MLSNSNAFYGKKIAACELGRWPAKGEHMLKRRGMVLLGLWVFAWGLSPLVGLAAEEDWQTDLSFSYTSGNYGTTERTNVRYAPLSIRRLLPDGDITLVIPYLHLTSDAAVTIVNGIPQAAGGQQAARTRTISEGLGDILLRGRYYVLDEQGLLPTVAVTGRVKFPTADEAKGLGTGQFDESAGLEVTKYLSENWLGLADFTYTLVGKLDTITLRNQWFFDVGLGYSFTKDFLGSVYYEEQQSPVPGRTNPRDALAAFSHRITSLVRLNMALMLGLNSSSPDYGITGGLSLRF
jgi:hypothetical protein